MDQGRWARAIVICLLCQGHSLSKWHEDKARSYFRCENCSLVFVPRESLLTPDEEKKRYDTHENIEGDPRYREYLTKIVHGAMPFLHRGAIGLDFGCGASTFLSTIFNEEGFRVDSYDLYYRPSEKIWEATYDFIVLSEVIEHLSDPLAIMESLQGRLKSNGQFFIKTKYYSPDRQQFPNWYYKNDPTHVQFFDSKSMESLASMLKMKGPQDLNCPDLIRIWN